MINMINLKINTNENVYYIKCKKGTNLKEVIKNENINFIFPCGAKGRCGNCKVKALKGIEQPTSLDKIKLSNYELNQNIRLACCIYLNQDTEIFLKEITEYNFLDL